MVITVKSINLHFDIIKCSHACFAVVTEEIQKPTKKRALTTAQFEVTKPKKQPRRTKKKVIKKSVWSLFTTSACECMSPKERKLRDGSEWPYCVS